MKALVSAILVVASILGISASAFGDTVELRDGKLVKGQYLGGTATTVRFQVGKETQVIPVGSIVAITFDAREETKPPAAKEQEATAEKAEKKAAEPAPAQVTVPAGSPILISMDQAINSKQHKAGTNFTGKLAAPLQVGDKAILPIGTPVYGKLVESKSGGRLARRAELRLELTHILVGSTRVAIGTTDVKAKGDGQGTVGKVAAGAAVGGIADGKSGRRTGAAVGAGAAVLTGGKQVDVPKGALLEFKLKHALVIGTK